MGHSPLDKLKKIVYNKDTTKGKEVIKMTTYRFKEEELIEINGKFVEKKFAFPDLEGDQTAFMVKWNGEKWILSGWGSCIDGNDKVACGWEPFMENTKENILSVLSEIMSVVEGE